MTCVSPELEIKAAISVMSSSFPIKEIFNLNINLEDLLPISVDSFSFQVRVYNPYFQVVS
jgi:hypothetical protein